MEQFYILIVLSLGSTISTIRPGGIFLDLPINQSLKSLFPASDTVVSFLVRPNGNSVPWLSGHSLSLPYSDSSSFLEHADFVVVGNLSQSVFGVGIDTLSPSVVVYVVFFFVLLYQLPHFYRELKNCITIIFPKFLRSPLRKKLFYKFCN